MKPLKVLQAGCLTKLEMENAKLLTQIGGLAKAEAAATDSGPTLSEISALYSKGLSQLQTDLGFEVNSSTGIMTIQGPEGDILEGTEAQAYWKEQKDAWKSDFVQTSIFDATGNYVSNDADFAARSLGLGDIASSVRESLVQAPPAASASTDSTKPKTTAEKVKADPDKYVADVFAANPSTPPENVRAALLAAGVPTDQVDTIINNATAFLGG